MDFLCLFYVLLPTKVCEFRKQIGGVGGDTKKAYLQY